MWTVFLRRVATRIQCQLNQVQSISPVFQLLKTKLSDQCLLPPCEQLQRRCFTAWYSSLSVTGCPPLLPALAQSTLTSFPKESFSTSTAISKVQLLCCRINSFHKIPLAPADPKRVLPFSKKCLKLDTHGQGISTMHTCSCVFLPAKLLGISWHCLVPEKEAQGTPAAYNTHAAYALSRWKKGKESTAI